MTDNKMRTFGILMASLVSAQVSANDQAEASRRPEIVGNLYQCAEVPVPEARLACYERQTAALKAAEAANEIIFADKSQVRETRRGLFGFSLPKIRLFDSVDEDGGDEVKELSSTLARVSESQSGRWTFVLEDGAQWVQVDDTQVVRNPAPGDPIVIKQGAMGGYMASVSGRRSMRVKRVN